MSAQNTASTVERDIFSVAYQKSPLWFSGGILGQDYVPVPLSTLLTDAIGVGVSDISGAIEGHLGTGSLDDLLLDWLPASTPNGSTLFQVEPATYPLPTQSMAANAQISQPLATSLQLSISPHTIGHYTSLLLAVPAMKNLFQIHSNLGGLYDILTPSYLWTDMMMIKFTDITQDPASAPGSLFQLDFKKPATQPSGLGYLLDKNLQSFASGLFS